MDYRSARSRSPRASPVEVPIHGDMSPTAASSLADDELTQALDAANVGGDDVPDHRSEEVKVRVLQKAVRILEARVDAMKAKADQQDALLKDHKEQLAEWQRWWDMYGESMSW